MAKMLSLKRGDTKCVCLLSTMYSFIMVEDKPEVVQDSNFAIHAFYVFSTEFGIAQQEIQILILNNFLQIPTCP